MMNLTYFQVQQFVEIHEKMKPEILEIIQNYNREES